MILITKAMMSSIVSKKNTRMCVLCRFKDLGINLHRFQLQDGEAIKFNHLHARSFYFCNNCFKDYKSINEHSLNNVKFKKYLKRIRSKDK